MTTDKDSQPPEGSRDQLTVGSLSLLVSLSDCSTGSSGQKMRVKASNRRVDVCSRSTDE